MLAATDGDVGSSPKRPEPSVTSAQFPRTARLLKGGEYERVFKRAIRSRDEGFTVLAIKTSNPTATVCADPAALSRAHQDHGRARLGLAISKRQVRSAVKRNRIKRRVRESFRHQQSALAGMDIVVLARGGVDTWTSKAIDISLSRHWRQVIRKCAG